MSMGYELRIDKQDGYSSWKIASFFVEMSYEGAKMCYKKDSFERLNFKILYEIMKRQLDTQEYKNYNNDSTFLNFSKIEAECVVKIVELFDLYKENKELSDIEPFHELSKSLNLQLKEILEK